MVFIRLQREDGSAVQGAGIRGEKGPCPRRITCQQNHEVFSDLYTSRAIQPDILRIVVNGTWNSNDGKQVGQRAARERLELRGVL